MNPGQPIRLPLQIGTSSIWSLARASASLLSGPVLSALAVVACLQDRLPFLAGRCSHRGRQSSCSSLPSLTSVARCETDRATSSLSADGLRVEGGRYDGLTVPWTEIDRDAAS